MSMVYRTPLLWLMVMSFLLVSRQTLAAPASQRSTVRSATQAAQRPWSVGVAPTQREAALALFRKGNTLYAARKHAAAAKVYRAALKLWRHPAIHGNLAVVLINLDDPVAAKAHLTRALAYGAAPLERHVHQQLLTHQKLVDKQLAHLEVVCETAEAVVLLNGEKILAGPGKISFTKRIGQYVLVAKRKGFLTLSRQITLLPGRSRKVSLRLVPLAEAGGYTRRWRPWISWVAMGTGVALLAAGISFELASRNTINTYEDEVARLCPQGCEEGSLPQSVRDLEGRAQRYGGLGIAGLVGGGVLLIGGVVMTILNQPRRVAVDETGRRLSFLPLLTGDVAGVAMTARY